MTLTNTTSKAAVSALKSMFARHGIPDICVSDNAPQFGSTEFMDLVTDWDFTHKTSSPHYPRANGLAKGAVKTMKRMIKKCQDTGQDFHKALLAYRATPLQNGLSPAQMLMNRRIETTLPVHHKQLEPAVYAGVTAGKVHIREKQKQLHDKTACGLLPLCVDDRVRLQNYRTKIKLWTEGATVLHKVAPMSYEVRTDSGMILHCNQ